ncbi:MAG: (Fe-S)-binding protein [Planctomycetota bacterium]|jgi:L-lactate dehydrogenase complex protein LldE
MRVALFASCLTDLFLPRAAVAVVRVLEHLGHDVSFPQGQTCCGQPMYNNGLRQDAKQLARRMIDLFQDAEAVVTPSGSCAAMIREHYPNLFETGSAEHDRAADLVARTFEFVEFLDRVLEIDPATIGVRWSGRATHHVSCHMRGIGLADESRNALEKIDGLTLAPTPRADECCGFGGTFSVGFAAASGHMGREKVAAIRETGCETVISHDAGCTMHLAGICRREQCAVRFLSPAEVIAEGLGLLDPEVRP